MSKMRDKQNIGVGLRKQKKGIQQPVCTFAEEHQKEKYMMNKG